MARGVRGPLARVTKADARDRWLAGARVKFASSRNLQEGWAFNREELGDKPFEHFANSGVCFYAPASEVKTSTASPIEDLQALEDVSLLIAESLDERARLIVAARVDGWPWAAIQRATGLARQTCVTLATEANGGVLPVPRQRSAG